MDVVLVLFQKKLIPVVADPEKNFMITSWQESLKVSGSFVKNQFQFLSK